MLQAYLALLSSIGASVLNVFLSWFFIFRHKSFDDMNKSLEKKKSDLAELKKTVENDEKNEKRLQKRFKKLEQEVNSLQSALTQKTVYSSLFLNIFLFQFNRLIKATFDGKIIAKIPFEPFSLVTKITHSGLDSDDMTDGNFQVVYWLGTTLFKDVLMRWFGFIMPSMKMPNSFAQH